MITFLFWNLNKKSLEGRVTRLAEKHEVDIVILAECSIPPQSMVDALHQRTGRRFNLPFSAYEKVVIYTRFPKRFLKARREGERFTIRKLALPGLDDVLIVATHFPSKLFWSKESQAQECVKLSEEIQLAEKRAGHSRTILVGDLNMNPFEDGIVSASGLHGVMTRQIAAKQTRIVQDREYPFFYNPMWGHIGDGTEGPAGTHYNHRSEHVSFFWNMFDQVLLRPALLPFFRNEELKILADDGEEPLVNQIGLPDDSVASDHLPILFRLNLYFEEEIMATNQLDLWPTITATATAQNTPVSILRIQADLLQKKTDGMVEAYVRSRQLERGEVLSAIIHLGLDGGNAFAYSFYLVAPALENYQYLLFWMIQPIEMYPLLIKDGPEGDIDVESEDAFIGALRTIFAHEKTQQVIQAMIAQSRA